MAIELLYGRDGPVNGIKERFLGRSISEVKNYRVFSYLPLTTCDSLLHLFTLAVIIFKEEAE